MIDDTYEVRITSGESPGPYTVYLDSIEGKIANTVDGEPAEHIPYESLAIPEFVSVIVPKGTTKLILYNELCKNVVEYKIPIDCNFGFILEMAVPEPTPTPTPSSTPEPPSAKGVDLVFILDYTATMSPTINSIKNSIGQVVSAVTKKTTKTYRLGLVLFDEYQYWSVPPTATKPNGVMVEPLYSKSTDYLALPPSQRIRNKGDGGVKNFGTQQVITAMEMMSDNNSVSFSAQLKKINTTALPLGNGYSIPEPSNYAISLVANQSFAGEFRPDVAKIVIVITDALSGGTDDAYTVADDTFNAALGETLKSKEIIMMLCSTYKQATTDSLRKMATDTGGKYFSTMNVSDIVKAIESIP